MESLKHRYNRKLLENALNQSIIGIGQIADEDSAVETMQQKKYNPEATDVILRRYKIRICSQHDDTVPVKDLPWAYGQAPTSGLRGECSGIPSYPINTFVTVFQDPQTGHYYIGDVHPNSVDKLPEKKAAGCAPASGFKPGSSKFYVPSTHIGPDGKSIAPRSEVFGCTVPSQEDKKQNSHNEAITIPTACRPVNTDAINSELTNFVKGIEGLRAGLTGKDSFLATSQNFINDVQAEVDKIAKKISGWITWLIQEIRKFILRKVNAAINLATGGVPLSQRYLINETTDKSLSLISCLFVQLLQNLERLVGQFLSTLIDKFTNTAVCLIEGFISNFIGQLLAQIFSAINSILGIISSLIGIVINIINEVFDFVISIVDLLQCKVKNVCPVVEKWNFLEGAEDASAFGNLDFTKIFNDAKGIVDSFTNIIELPESGIFDFNFDTDSALDNVLNGCGLDADSCGPPTISFWGGGGSGAKGNAIVSAAGDILGIDIIAPGSGYTEAPFVSIIDSCGIGKGAVATAQIGPVADAGTGIGADGTGGGTGIGTGEAGIGTDGTGGGADGTGGVTGVTGVIIKETGSGYLPAPNGDKGGLGRISENRCQSTVLRFDRTKSLPYNPGEVITLYPGDTVNLAGKDSVLITEDFEESMIPGSIVHNRIVVIKEMSGFDDSKGADQGAANQFGYLNDYPYAKSLGFRDIDIRYYLENGYKGKIEPEMKKVLSNPKWGKIPSGLIFKIKNMVGFDDKWGSNAATTQPVPAAHAQRIQTLIDEYGGAAALANEKNKELFISLYGVYRGDHFSFTNDYPAAKEQGYSDIDIRYYLENEYKKTIGPLMELVLTDPNFGRLPKFYVTVSSPECPPPPPKPPSYPVAPSIKDIDIPDGGFGFEDGDTLTVVPDNGAILEPIILNGSIVRVKVVNPGIGFTEMPEIVINTDTGYNARFNPILNFNPIAIDNIPPGIQIVNVVDCVGKV